MAKDRATVSVGDGNGGTRLVIDMKIWQWLLAMILSISAVFAGAYQAVYKVSEMAVHRWFDAEGRTQVEEIIDSKIQVHVNEATRDYNIDMKEIRDSLSRLTTLVEGK